MFRNKLQFQARGLEAWKAQVSVLIVRGLAQWRSQALIETKFGQIHQLHSMYVPLMRRCCMGAHTGPVGISGFHTVVTADFTAQQR